MGLALLTPAGARADATVEYPSPVPPPPAAATPKVSLGKAALNGNTGRASIAVTVNEAGLLTLSGKNVKRTVLKAGARGTVLMPIVPKGKAVRQLGRRGRAKVAIAVSLAGADGQKANASRKLTLRQRRR